MLMLIEYLTIERKVSFSFLFVSHSILKLLTSNVCQEARRQTMNNTLHYQHYILRNFIRSSLLIRPNTISSSLWAAGAEQWERRDYGLRRRLLVITTLWQLSECVSDQTKWTLLLTWYFISSSGDVCRWCLLPSVWCERIIKFQPVSVCRFWFKIRKCICSHMQSRIHSPSSSIVFTVYHHVNWQFISGRQFL